MEVHLLLYKATYSAFRLYIFCQYVCSLRIEPTTFCAANAMLYHFFQLFFDLGIHAFWSHSVTDSELRAQAWWRTAVWTQTLNGSRIKELVHPEIKINDHNLCLTHTLFHTWMCFFLLLNIKADILNNMAYQTVDFHSIFIPYYGSQWLPSN